MVKNLPANAGAAGDVGLIPWLGRCPGEENGNPLQDSCLGNPTHRGAWRATVHGVTKSRTRLNTHTRCYFRRLLLKRVFLTPHFKSKHQGFQVFWKTLLQRFHHGCSLFSVSNWSCELFLSNNAAVPVDMIHPRVLGPNRLAGVTNGLSANVMQAEVLHASLLPGAPATYQDKN